MTKACYAEPLKSIQDGGMFDALAKLSTTVPSAYHRASEFKDLYLGHLHLIEITEDGDEQTKSVNAPQWVGLAVVQSYNPKRKVPHSNISIFDLEHCLSKASFSAAQNSAMALGDPCSSVVPDSDPREYCPPPPHEFKPVGLKLYKPKRNTFDRGLVLREPEVHFSGKNRESVSVVPLITIKISSPPTKPQCYITQQHHSPSAAAANGTSSNRQAPAGHILFRLLCHSSHIGGVISKSSMTPDSPRASHAFTVVVGGGGDWEKREGC
ncbi:hypothetical protein RHGRI_033128 [Rhododendron griersonianum]|uniref:Uncharacterized protein n=1 Tax=Rhododendron griersonianum TaxID=479676 RepID=A0AAV6HVF7_9ERIC|nr:hypothetical protein RHGRI_033128 [Rhododendron griersonianum]